MRVSRATGAPRLCRPPPESFRRRTCLIGPHEWIRTTTFRDLSSMPLPVGLHGDICFLKWLGWLDSNQHPPSSPHISHENKPSHVEGREGCADSNKVRIVTATSGDSDTDGSSAADRRPEPDRLRAEARRPPAERPPQGQVPRQWAERPQRDRGR